MVITLKLPPHHPDFLYHLYFAVSLGNSEILRLNKSPHDECTCAPLGREWRSHTPDASELEQTRGRKGCSQARCGRVLVLLTPLRLFLSVSRGTEGKGRLQLPLPGLVMTLAGGAQPAQVPA